MGDKELDSIIQRIEKIPNSKKIIFMFDRDNNEIIKKYTNEEFNNHSNNVYSFCIPKIDDNLDKISLEFYYNEDDLKTTDEKERRLFIGNEFNPNTAVSRCKRFVIKNKYEVKPLEIIDNNVFALEDEEFKTNLALPKNHFAEYILNNKKGFDNFNIGNFKKIFDVIEKIVNEQ